MPLRKEREGGHNKNAQGENNDTDYKIRPFKIVKKGTDPFFISLHNGLIHTIGYSTPYSKLRHGQKSDYAYIKGIYSVYAVAKAIDQKPADNNRACK